MSVENFRKKFRFLRKESGSKSPMPDWKKPRVLHVANDDGHLLTALLTRDGHEVTKADCTSQALNLNALEQFDYIVIERPSPRESVLRESEKRFRATFEQAAVGVAHSSLDGRLLLMNQKLCDIVGYTPEEIVTKTYQEVTHPDDLEAELEYARRLLAGEIESCSYEKRYVRNDGTLIWVNLTASVVRDEETGEPSYFVAIIEDISARKGAEEALRESEEALRKSYARIEDLAGRLIASQEEERRHIARELHDDLNQQVAALAIGISRLKRQFSNADDTVLEQIAKLQNKTDLLSDRIRQVSHELHSSILQHVGLPAALNSYCAEFSDREGIAVTLDIRDGVEAVSQDAALCLYRVAQESLRNVAKHSGARSAIVALTHVNGAVELRVVDEGVGFDPGQARESRGLGLVSMEERVKLLHGNFVLTTRPGAGTELRAQIPLRR